MNDYHYIDYLLDLYFKGGTSLEQEREICRYFNSGRIAPRHRELEPLFEYFSEEAPDLNPGDPINESEIPLNEPEIPQRETGITAAGRKDPVCIQPGRKNKRKIFMRTDKRKFYLPAAAAACLLLAVGTLLLNPSRNPEYKLTVGGKNIKNKELAMEIAREKLCRLNLSLKSIEDRTAVLTKISDAGRRLEKLRSFELPVSIQPSGTNKRN